MPSSIARGYKIPHNGTTLFLSYGMYAPIPGEYTIIHVNLNEIEFSNSWTNFCDMNQLVVASLVAVRVEMREHYIGLFVAKIR